MADASVFDQLRVSFAAGQDAAFITALLALGLPAGLLAVAAASSLAVARCRVSRVLPALLTCRCCGSSRAPVSPSPAYRSLLTWVTMLLGAAGAAAAALLLAFGAVVGRTVDPPLLGAGVATIPLAAAFGLFSCARFRASGGVTPYPSLGPTASGSCARRAWKRAFAFTLGGGAAAALLTAAAAITAYELAVVLFQPHFYSYLSAAWVFLAWNACFAIKSLYTGLLGRLSDGGSLGALSPRLATALALEWLRLGGGSSSSPPAAFAAGDAAALAALAARSPLVASFLVAGGGAGAAEEEENDGSCPVPRGAIKALQRAVVAEGTGAEGDDAGWRVDGKALARALGQRPTSSSSSSATLPSLPRPASAASSAALWYVLSLAVLGAFIATHLALAPDGARGGRNLVFVTVAAVVLLDATTAAAAAGGLLPSPRAAAALAGAGRVCLVAFGSQWWLLGIAAAYTLAGGMVASVAAGRLVAALAAQGSSFAAAAGSAAAAGAAAATRSARRVSLAGWLGLRSSRRVLLAAPSSSSSPASSPSSSSACCGRVWSVATAPPILLLLLTLLFSGFVALLAVLQAREGSTLPAAPVTLPDGSHPTPQYVFPILAVLGVAGWGVGQVTLQGWRLRHRTWTPAAIAVAVGGFAALAVGGGLAFHFSGVGLALVLGVFLPPLFSTLLALHGQWRRDDWALWVPGAPRRNAAMVIGAVTAVGLLVGAAATLAATTDPSWVGWASLGCALGIILTVMPVLQWFRTLRFGLAQPISLALALVAHGLAHGLVIRALVTDNEEAGGSACFEATETASYSCHIARWAAASVIGAPSLLSLGLALYKLADDGWRLSVLVLAAGPTAAAVATGVGAALVAIYRNQSAIPAVLLALWVLVCVAGVVGVRYKTAGGWLSRPWRIGAAVAAGAAGCGALIVALYQLLARGNVLQFMLWLSAGWLGGAAALLAGGLGALAATGAFRPALPGSALLGSRQHRHHASQAGRLAARSRRSLHGTAADAVAAAAGDHISVSPLTAAAAAATAAAGGKVADGDDDSGGHAEAALAAYKAALDATMSDALASAAATVRVAAASAASAAAALLRPAEASPAAAESPAAGWLTFFSPTLLPVYAYDPALGRVVPSNTGAALVVTGFFLMLAWGLLAIVFLAPPFVGIIAVSLAKTGLVLFVLDATLKTRGDLRTAVVVLAAAAGGRAGASATTSPWQRAWAGRLRLLDTLAGALQTAASRVHAEANGGLELLEGGSDGAASGAELATTLGGYYGLLPARLLATRASSLTRLLLRRTMTGTPLLEALLCLRACGGGCRATGGSSRSNGAGRVASAGASASSPAQPVTNPFRAAASTAAGTGAASSGSSTTQVHVALTLSSQPAPFATSSSSSHPTAFLVADPAASVYSDAAAPLRALLTSFHPRRNFAAAVDASSLALTDSAAGGGFSGVAVAALAREALALDAAAAVAGRLEARFLAELQHAVVAAGAAAEADATREWTELLAWAALPASAALLAALGRPEVAAFAAHLAGTPAPPALVVAAGPMSSEPASSAAPALAPSPAPAPAPASFAILPPRSALASRPALLAWAAASRGAGEADALAADLAVLDASAAAFNAACDASAQAERAEEEKQAAVRRAAAEASERAAAAAEAGAVARALEQARTAAAVAAAEADALRRALDAERERAVAAARAAAAEHARRDEEEHARREAEAAERAAREAARARAAQEEAAAAAAAQEAARAAAAAASSREEQERARLQIEAAAAAAVAAAAERTRAEALEAARREIEEAREAAAAAAAEVEALRRALDAETQRAAEARAAEAAALRRADEERQRREAEAAERAQAEEARRRQEDEEAAARAAAAERARAEAEAEALRRALEAETRRVQEAAAAEAAARRREAEEQARRATEAAEAAAAERARREAEAAARREAQAAVARRREEERVRRAAVEAARTAEAERARQAAATAAREKAERLAREAAEAERAAAAAAAAKARAEAEAAAAAAAAPGASATNASSGTKTQAQLLAESEERARVQLTRLRQEAHKGPWVDNSWTPAMWGKELLTKPTTEVRLPDCAPNSVIIQDGFDVADAKQGNLGDCWLIAGLGVLATKPELLERLFITKTVDPKGIYGFRFIKNGAWAEYFIDDQLLAYENSYRVEGIAGTWSGPFRGPPHSSGKPRLPVLCYCTSRTGSEFWPALLEKAFAAYWGGYPQLKSGHAVEAWAAAIPGAITEVVSFQNDSAKKDIASGALWRRLRAYAAEGHLLGALSQGKIDRNIVDGIVQGHAFSILRVEEIRDSNGTHQLLQLRNPWGNTEWGGKWGDADKDSWTSRTRTLLGYDPVASGDDGIFWMAWNDFLTYYKGLYFARTYKTVAEGGPWHLCSARGAWRGASAAGWKDDTGANPQFFLAPATKCKIVVHVVQLPDRWGRKEAGAVFNHGVRLIRNGGVRAGWRFYEGQLLHSTNTWAAEIHFEMTLEPAPDGKPHVLQCLPVTAGNEAGFLVRVYSDAPLKAEWHAGGKLKPLP